jgi:Fe-S cluster assembly iron-binding protein IscA
VPGRVLSLDVSTNTGYAVFDGGADVLVAYGFMAMMKRPSQYPLPYPLNYAVAATDYARALVTLVEQFEPVAIVVEETNPGHEVLSQRTLEWIHMALNLKLGMATKVCYVRTGDWRRAVGLQLSKVQAKANLKKSLEKAKKEASAIRFLIKAAGTSKVNAMHVAKLKKDLKALQLFRTTRKHLAVNMVNELYKLDLKIADNDTADAILLGRAFYLGATVCDGKMPSKKQS